MFKKLSLIILTILAVSCTYLPHPQSNCAPVEIPRDKAYMVQKVNYSDDFQIELIGYDSYCYYDEQLDRNTLYITPQFSVSRLRTLDETHVDFHFYTETRNGPPAFLGKRVYSTGTDIGAGEREKTFSGKQVKVLTPKDPDDFVVSLALDISAAQNVYNQRTFDIKYRYNLPDEEMIERTVIINNDPVDFPQARGGKQPTAPASNAPQTSKPQNSGCFSCSLFN